MSIFSAVNSIPRTITFSSENSTSGSGSTFSNTPVDMGVNDYDSVVLIDANIPKSFYNIPSGYNTFTLTESSSSVTITIPAASYNINNLLTVLSTQLTTNSPHSYTYVCTYSATNVGDTFKITFTVTGNGGVQPVITMLSGQSSPFRQLGFDDASTNTFVGSTLSSTNAVNLSLVLTAYIVSNIVLGAYQGILQQFLNIGSYPPLSVIYFNQINYDINAKYFNLSNKNSWNFSLVDDLFLPINTNGVPWSFTLCFFKRNDTHEAVKTNLQLENQQRIFDLQQRQQEILANLHGIEPFNDTVLPQFQDPQIHYPDSADYPLI